MTVEHAEEDDDDDDDDGSATGRAPARPEPPNIFWQVDQQAFDPLVYLPPTRKIPWFWQKFVERVDPFVKLLHIPSAAPHFLAFDPRTSPVSAQPLFFAVCYCVACSLRPDECVAELGDDRDVLLLRYRAATQRALCAARFMATQELPVLQALILLLSCVRGGREAEELWTLMGLAIRVAQHMGLHHDAGNSISPFAAEMRRRAWWQLCVLDLQIAEARCAESSLMDLAFDTRMPLNVRDDDLAPDMPALPPPRKGCTEMTATLMSGETFDMLRHMSHTRPSQAPVVYQQRCSRLAAFAAKVEEAYLTKGARHDSLLRCNRALFRFLHCRCLLLLHRPFRPQGRGPGLPQDTRDRLFEACLEALESWYALAADAIDAGRNASIRTDTLLQILVLVLLQLCDGREDALAERAWHVVMAAQLPSRDGSLQPRMRRLVDPVQSLLDRAKQLRETQLQRRRAETGGQAWKDQTCHSLQPESPLSAAALLQSTSANKMSGSRMSVDGGVVPTSAGLETSAGTSESLETLHGMDSAGAGPALPIDLAAFGEEFSSLAFPDNVMWLEFQGFTNPSDSGPAI